MTELDVEDAGSSKIYEVRLSLICPRGSLSSEGLEDLLDSEYLEIAKAAAAPASAAPTAVTISLVFSLVADDMILVVFLDPQHRLSLLKVSFSQMNYTSNNSLRNSGAVESTEVQFGW